MVDAGSEPMYAEKIRVPPPLDTKSGWILEKKLTPQPLWYPKVPPLGHDQGGQMKIPSDMFYIFHFWEDTQSLV